MVHFSREHLLRSCLFILLARRGPQKERKREKMLCIFSVVGVRGLEPPTSWSQTMRASQLRYTPILDTNEVSVLSPAFSLSAAK